MIVKICGITAVEEAELALEHGANALGFNFWQRSPRYLRPEAAEAIIARVRGPGMPAFLSVGILVGTNGWEACPTDVLQFHGLKSAADMPDTSGAGSAGVSPALGHGASRSGNHPRIWVATDPDSIDRFPECEIVIDSSWGKGRVADWENLASIRRPFILSGGLTAENVGTAIRRLRPAGIDVCSGVESHPGHKDPERLKRFLGEVQRALR